MIIRFTDNNQPDPEISPHYLTSLQEDYLTGEVDFSCNRFNPWLGAGSMTHFKGQVERLDKIKADLFLRHWYGSGRYNLNRWAVSVLPDPN